MNAVPLLGQELLQENTLNTSKNSSFSVRDILQLPSSQNSYSTETLSARNIPITASTSSAQMIAHDLFPQSGLRSLPLSAGNFSQREERQFPDRFSYSPQYTEQSNSNDSRFSYPRENQNYRRQSDSQHSVLGGSLSVQHGINMGSNGHLSATEKRVHSVDSITEASASPTTCPTSYSAGIPNSIEDLQFDKNQRDSRKGENFGANLTEDGNYSSTIEYPSVKDKYRLDVNEQLTPDFSTSCIIQKPDNDVFLPDENETDKRPTEWRKADENAEMKFKGEFE